MTSATSLYVKKMFPWEDRFCIRVLFMRGWGFYGGFGEERRDLFEVVRLGLGF
jgi:hypothetical protein